MPITHTISLAAAALAPGHIAGLPYRICPACARQYSTPSEFLAGTIGGEVVSRAHRYCDRVSGHRVLMEMRSDLQVRRCGERGCGGSMWREIAITHEVAQVYASGGFIATRDGAPLMERPSCITIPAPLAEALRQGAHKSIPDPAGGGDA